LQHVVLWRRGDGDAPAHLRGHAVHQSGADGLLEVKVFFCFHSPSFDSYTTTPFGKSSLLVANAVS